MRTHSKSQILSPHHRIHDDILDMRNNAASMREFSIEN